MEIKGNQLSDMKSNGSSPLEQKKYVNALVNPGESSDVGFLEKERIWM